MVVEDVPRPSPGPGEVLVRIAAAGVNFIEIYQRSGVYQVSLPMTPGVEGAGEIVEVGDGVDASRIGTRVASVNLAGSYAEFATAAADRVVPVPDDMTGAPPRAPCCRA